MTQQPNHQQSSHLLQQAESNNMSASSTVNLLLTNLQPSDQSMPSTILLPLFLSLQSSFLSVTEAIQSKLNMLEQNQNVLLSRLEKLEQYVQTKSANNASFVQLQNNCLNTAPLASGSVSNLILSSPTPASSSSNKDSPSISITPATPSSNTASSSTSSPSIFTSMAIKLHSHHVANAASIGVTKNKRRGKAAKEAKLYFCKEHDKAFSSISNYYRHMREVHERHSRRKDSKRSNSNDMPAISGEGNGGTEADAEEEFDTQLQYFDEILGTTIAPNIETQRNGFDNLLVEQHKNNALVKEGEDACTHSECSVAYDESSDESNEGFTLF